MSTQTKNDLGKAIKEQRDALLNVFGFTKTETLGSVEPCELYGMKVETNDFLPAGIFVIGGEIVVDPDAVSSKAE